MNGYIIHAENSTLFSSADVSDVPVAFSHAQKAGIFFVSGDVQKTFTILIFLTS